MNGIFYPPTTASITSGNVVEITQNKIPPSSGGVITLEEGKTYIVIGEVDLFGDRIEGPAGSVDLIGFSSESSILKSTGLGAGVPIITATHTMPLRHLTIQDVDTALDFDGTGNTMALDWTGVNFKNVPNIGMVDNCDNLIYNKGAFINSQNLVLDGTSGTIAFENSIFTGDGTVGDIIKLQPTLNITRRFRMTYSSVVAFGSTIGINADNGATIPVSSYILDTDNFSGGGTYLSGITSDDNRSEFSNCKGIENTVSVAVHNMNNNMTATPIANINTPVKVLGTTVNDTSVTRRFTHSNNRDTYIGEIEKYFLVTKTVSLTSNNNNDIGLFIAINGSVITNSEINVTTDGAGRSDNATVQAFVLLQPGDFIELFAENESSPNPITVSYIKSIVTEGA